MTTRIEDILSILCTSVTLAHSNDFQQVFTLTDSTDAKLAFDVLVAYGLDVKVYPQDDDSSKLYVTTPKLSPAQLEKTLSSAKIYATALKQINASLEQLCTDGELVLGDIEYSVNFTNSARNSKQILVQISPAVASDNPIIRPVEVLAPVAAAAAPRPTVKRPVAAKAQDDFTSGPVVGKGKYPGSGPEDGTVPEVSLKRRIFLYLFGNAATGGIAMLLIVVIVGILFSLFVFAKAFLCPDFAGSKKSDAWYCQKPGNEDDQKKQQRQNQIGLPPT